MKPIKKTVTVTKPIKKYIEVTKEYWSCGKCNTHHKTYETALNCINSNRKSMAEINKEHVVRIEKVFMMLEYILSGGDLDDIAKELGITKSYFHSKLRSIVWRCRFMHYAHIKEGKSIFIAEDIHSDFVNKIGGYNYGGLRGIMKNKDLFLKYIVPFKDEMIKFSRLL